MIQITMAAQITMYLMLCQKVQARDQDSAAIMKSRFLVDSLGLVWNELILEFLDFRKEINRT